MTPNKAQIAEMGLKNGEKEGSKMTKKWAKNG